MALWHAGLPEGAGQNRTLHAAIFIILSIRMACEIQHSVVNVRSP